MTDQMLDSANRSRLPVPRFSARLADLVKASGMTQSEFATAVGLTQGYVSKMLNGKERPPAEVSIRRIAEVLHADADELMWLAEIVPPSLYAAGLFHVDLKRVRRMVGKAGTP